MKDIVDLHRTNFHLHLVNDRETKTLSPPSLKPYCLRRHYIILYSRSGDESRTPFFSPRHTPRNVHDPLFVDTMLESSFNYRPTFFFPKRSLIAPWQIISLRSTSFPSATSYCYFFNDILIDLTLPKSTFEFSRRRITNYASGITTLRNCYQFNS